MMKEENHFFHTLLIKVKSMQRIYTKPECTIPDEGKQEAANVFSHNTEIELQTPNGY